MACLQSAVKYTKTDPGWRVRRQVVDPHGIGSEYVPWVGAEPDEAAKEEAKAELAAVGTAGQ